MTQSNTYDYSKEETNFTYRRRTSAIGVRIQTWYRPQIPCPLPGNTSQERTAFKCGSRTETGCIHSVCIQLDETICVRRYIGTEDKARPGSQANNGLLGRGIGQRCCITGTTKREKRQGTMGERLWKDSKRHYLQTFFRSFGARYKRIPKRPRVTPSPQLYAIKREKLQELESLSNQGLIDLFFGDESHVCTQGYVPYGWQFPGENVFVPSMKSARLNIFGMVSRDNVYHGFTSRQSIKAENVAEFIDNFSLTITKPTIAHDIFRYSSQGAQKQAHTPIGSQFQVKMSCIACLYQLSIKHKDIGKARTSFVNRVNKNQGNRTPYGYSIKRVFNNKC